jgi:hypothetical protein
MEWRCNVGAIQTKCQRMEIEFRGRIVTVKL